MKFTYAAAAAAIALLGAVAVAQTTTAPTTTAPAVAAPPPPPPSTCPAYPPIPVVPSEAAVRNTKELNAGTATVNAAVSAFQTVHACRIEEVRKLKAHYDTRFAEAKAGQDAALALTTQWNGVVAAVNARGEPKKK